jgi:hypothetical protein
MTDILTELPERIDAPCAWYGPALNAQRDWLIELSSVEIAEIEAAVQQTNCDIPSLQAADFPLPVLSARLAAWRDEVLDDRGFVLLRGLPVERWTRQAAAIAFYGLGAHLGRALPQNAQGHVLGHVKDLGHSSRDPHTRIYQTRERQTYHTDSCDIVALLCLQPAKRGGLSSLVSSTTIYNEMRQRRPDLLAELFKPIETDRRGEIPVGALPWFNIPVFNWHAGLLSAIYQRQYIESARRFAAVPPLTPRQIEALDLFDALANDLALHLLMEFRRGDVQLVHNHTLLHDRTAFEDWPEPERRRHLLRLWLAPPQARPLPPIYAERYGSVTPGARGGVNVAGARLIAPLEAE